MSQRRRKTKKKIPKKQQASMMTFSNSCNFSTLSLLLLALLSGLNVVARKPRLAHQRAPRGWSTWTTFQCAINETLVNDSITAIVSSPLFASGYDFVLIDDCWTTCEAFDSAAGGKCVQPGPRDSNGRIQINRTKFPNGFTALTHRAHALGLKVGIYTSVSAVTCGGYTGSLHHEDIDAQSFVEWGFDFVKHDTCGTDYSVHNGGLQNATRRMRDALWLHGDGRIVYYLDSGNPVSPQKMFNPRNRGVTSLEWKLKLATEPAELAWVWVDAMSADDDKGPHILKSWFDIHDTWESTLSNLHATIKTTEYQTCGRFNVPDYLTTGMGAQSFGQYRSQFFLWAVLGAPLFLSNDIRTMDAKHTDLVTNPEVLVVQNDSDCTQGSLVSVSDGGAEVWAKPLADNSIAAVLFNPSGMEANITVYFGGDWIGQADFFPTMFTAARVRDIGSGVEMGHFLSNFTALVAAQDAIMVRLWPST